MVVLFHLRQIYILAKIRQLNEMEAIVFVKNYVDYLDEISSVIRPELLPIIDELRQIDPHDLVLPESWFHSESEAKWIVWKLFIKQVKKYSPPE